MSVKISQLPSATSVTSDDLVPIVDNGSITTQKATAGQLLDFITGSTFNTLTVNSLTASISGTFTGNGSELYNLKIITSGNLTGSGIQSNPVRLKDDIILNSVTANILSGSQISGSDAVLNGDILIYGTGTLLNNPLDFAYFNFDTDLDKIVIYPGLKVSGSTIVSNNLNVFGTISASNYLGLPTSSGGTPGGINETIQFNSGSTFSGSSNLIYNYTTNTLSGTTAQFTTITGSTLTGSTARLTTVSASVVSASNYVGLPSSSLELTKLIVSSSVSLLTTQRAVFAKNSISSSISITLPNASLADSKEYHIIKADSVSGSVVVLPSSPNLINGALSFQLNGPYQAITLIHDGTDWYVF